MARVVWLPVRWRRLPAVLVALRWRASVRASQGASLD